MLLDAAARGGGQASGRRAAGKPRRPRPLRRRPRPVPVPRPASPCARRRAPATRPCAPTARSPRDQEHRHHERRDHDADRHREAHLDEQRDAGEHASTRTCPPGSAPAAPTDGPPCSIARSAAVRGSLPEPRLLPEAGDHQDVVVGADRHHEQVQDDRQRERQRRPGRRCPGTAIPWRRASRRSRAPRRPSGTAARPGCAASAPGSPRSAAPATGKMTFRSRLFASLDVGEDRAESRRPRRRARRRRRMGRRPALAPGGVECLVRVRAVGEQQVDLGGLAVLAEHARRCRPGRRA